ncbi:hypothetical protein [Aeromonas caviae]|uniref:Uncharacterized protein n=1 Tax=Aeromonas caviae TaxID=648 RepID=A0AAJ6CR26_AERCA|nr:hypothetical protein [Aeromonas caviae]WFG00254.1 hypothetical protein P5S46_21060 [Aeromonas caviae]
MKATMGYKAKVMIAALMVMSSPAMAATGGLGGWIDNIINFFKKIAELMMNGAYLGGLILGIVFLFTCKSLAKPNQEPGKAAIAVSSLLVAIALLNYDRFTSDSSTTVTGSDGSDNSKVDKGDYGL